MACKHLCVVYTIFNFYFVSTGRHICWAFHLITFHISASSLLRSGPEPPSGPPVWLLAGGRPVSLASASLRLEVFVSSNNRAQAWHAMSQTDQYVWQGGPWVASDFDPARLITRRCRTLTFRERARRAGGVYRQSMRASSMRWYHGLVWNKCWIIEGLRVFQKRPSLPEPDDLTFTSKRCPRPSPTSSAAADV